MQGNGAGESTESHRRLAAIMFTDMVGYSALAQTDEAAALSALAHHNRLLRPVFAKFHGREVKTVGDAFLVEFDSALDATRCALELQRSLREDNRSSPGGWKTQIRIGIHVGDVVQTGGDVLGDAVNIASRIEPLADPGGICLSQQTYDQVQNKITAQIVKMPPVLLKNIRLPATVYKVIPPGEGTSGSSAGAGLSVGRTLAVLPLVNISPDPRDEYFADGLTEELISVLSQVRDLSVVARTSVTPYKTAPKSISQAGADLGVETILEGSVRKMGNRVRITLQLIDVATQRHLWATSYNREIDDVFAVQSDIAGRTAGALQLELGKARRVGPNPGPTTNAQAYDLYLRGLVAAHDVNEKNIVEAVRCFEGATKLDPAFAEAFAAWGNLYVLAAGDYLRMRDVMPRARELAARALELDPESSEAHATLGNIALQFDHDWTTAEAEFQTAIALNASNVTAHVFYGMLLIAQERFDEALAVMRRGIRLDPGGGFRQMLAWAQLENGNVEDAIHSAEESRDRDPSSVNVRTALGLSYMTAGRRADALREAETPMTGATAVERFDRALLYALVGRPEPARALLAEAERGEAKVYLSATDLAMLYGALGEKEKALDLLERDFREGDQTLWLYYRGLFFDPIREDPRFVALLRQYGLPVGTGRRGPTPTH